MKHVQVPSSLRLVLSVLSQWEVLFGMGACCVMWLSLGYPLPLVLESSRGMRGGPPDTVAILATFLMGGLAVLVGSFIYIGAQPQIAVWRVLPVPPVAVSVPLWFALIAVPSLLAFLLFLPLFPNAYGLSGAFMFTLSWCGAQLLVNGSFKHRDWTWGLLGAALHGCGLLAVTFTMASRLAFSDHEWGITVSLLGLFTIASASVLASSLYISRQVRTGGRRRARSARLPWNSSEGLAARAPARQHSYLSKGLVNGLLMTLPPTGLIIMFLGSREAIMVFAWGRAGDSAASFSIFESAGGLLLWPAFAYLMAGIFARVSMDLPYGPLPHGRRAYARLLLSFYGAMAMAHALAFMLIALAIDIDPTALMAACCAQPAFMAIGIATHWIELRYGSGWTIFAAIGGIGAVYLAAAALPLWLACPILLVAALTITYKTYHGIQHELREQFGAYRTFLARSIAKAP